MENARVTLDDTLTLTPARLTLGFDDKDVGSPVALTVGHQIAAIFLTRRRTRKLLMPLRLRLMPYRCQRCHSQLEEILSVSEVWFRMNYSVTV